MDEPDVLPRVVDDAGQERFVAEQDGFTAQLEYEVDGDLLILIHTEVPQELGGRGLGGRLVAAGLARAARDSLTIAPWCPYARRWLQSHADAVAGAGVQVDWSDRPPL